MIRKKEDRIRRLSEEIRKRHSLHIRDAAELLDVSEMTIRRDIKEASDLFNFYGGHIVPFGSAPRNAPYDVTNESEVNRAAKIAACQAALPHIHSKDTIFVDCGTTVAHLVDMLPYEIEITLICYSLNIADLAVRRPNVTLIVLGGVYHPATASFAPLDQEQSFSNFAINVAFLSAAGLDETLGATCMTFHEAAVKRAAMQRAAKTVLVLDKSKLGTVAKACFGQHDDFDTIVTETGAFAFEKGSLSK